jgi:hypothetical protein
MPMMVLRFSRFLVTFTLGLFGGYLASKAWLETP